MLINDLRADPFLADYRSDTCCERGVCVDFDPSTPKEDYLVLKVDDFYNKQGLPKTPKSPDCLIVQRCKKGHFHVHVVELKNVKYQSDLDAGDIWDKFHTCLTDFMSNRFRDYFYNEKYDFQLQLYLVAGKVKEKYTQNYSLDFLLTLRPLQFANKFYGVQPENPNPMIRPC
ncbi:MAG: hypothetical protein MUC59_04480 [Saprospiraceae bacterium]|jgi:hypothetical protein|nr:hypothetical protein [Saprospiraceae bacterium]